MINFADMGKIPKQVIKAAEGRKHLGGTLKVIGERNGAVVYTYFYDTPMTIGMPELYLWDGHKVVVIEDEEALHMLNSF